MTSDIQYHATWNSDRYQDYIAIQFGHIYRDKYIVDILFYFQYEVYCTHTVTQQKWKNI